ncbi:hypothetical protein MPL3365_550005 [Mesorhizobium plurifarium]|uniref:Uncharacterized protein n=1 Tax=Mesorhizobium plurifarium TaxID=69974 RepID=A0A090GG73_MESPL|nr:hypothetical protein MPL3365_550005 [Mesorhizobium plurifarium]
MVQAAASSLLFSSKYPERPYICRLIVLSRLICPSTGLVLQGGVIAARDGLDVAADACSKGGQFAVRGIGDPLLEAGFIVAADQCGEASGEVASYQKLQPIFMKMVKEPLGLRFEDVGSSLKSHAQFRPDGGRHRKFGGTVDDPFMRRRSTCRRSPCCLQSRGV